MTADLTPAMCTVLTTIGTQSVTAHEIGVSGFVMKRLCDRGLLKIDFPKQGHFPPWYSISEQGKGAASILTAIMPFLGGHEGPVAQIKRVVAGHFKIPAFEMVSARRSRSVARPRQVAMYLTKQLTPKSLPDIGRQFGNRDHTTVIHAIRVIEALMSGDESFGREVEEIQRIIVSGEQDKNQSHPPINPQIEQNSTFAPAEAGA